MKLRPRKILPSQHPAKGHLNNYVLLAGILTSQQQLLLTPAVATLAFAVNFDAATVAAGVGG